MKDSTMKQRVMRLNNNPAARGFIVRVLEQLPGPTIDGSLRFATIASKTAGTKAAANKIYVAMRKQYGAK